MRNSTLRATLESFTVEATDQLLAETASGAEIPFELIESEPRSPGRAPLYCYRPLTGVFIRERLGLLTALPSYAPAARALEALDGLPVYLRHRGEPLIPSDPRDRADAALRCMLARVFGERTEFGHDIEQFETAYAELEAAVYDGRRVTTVIAPLLGIALSAATDELALGEGCSLISGRAMPDAPAEAIWGLGASDALGAEEPNVLAVLTVTEGQTAQSPVALARGRFRRLLTALRLFERGGYALGPLAWTRSDGGAWGSVAIGGGGRPRSITLIAPTQEDELRGFCNLITKRAPSGGEIAWALARFEMGCERLAPFEALTDYLLALRAVLEPEGPSSGRLAQRLAVICARPEERAALAERTAHAISLERAVIAGLAPAETGVDALVEEISEHLRALLRDVLCGHLDSDLRSVADELLAEATASAS